MAAPLKPLSVFPDLPRDPKIIDKDGELTSNWKLYFEQLNQTLQTVFKAEGTVIPQQPTSNIALLTDIKSLANIIYDSTTNEFKGNVQTAPNTYTWKTFTLV